VEKDLRLRELLSSLVAKSPNIDLHFSDILKFDFTRHMKPGYKVVANIPYYVTGKLVQLLLRAPLRPRSITVLIQKEVAENMVARAGKTNLLALSVQLVGSPQIVRVVPARDFFPIPKVDSAVAHIDLFSEPLLSGVDEKMFFRVAKACFVGKRKQLHNTLSANLGLPKAAVSELLGGMGLSPTVRPQELSVGQFVKLSLLIRPYLLA
jgi:16S rRNA (adenine1518-N6/adenine1519-N6)-dimethyltransferase